MELTQKQAFPSPGDSADHRRAWLSVEAVVAGYISEGDGRHICVWYKYVPCHTVISLHATE